MGRRAIETTKISIAISADDLRVLRARAKRLYGGNLSAAVADATAKLRREEAAHRVLERLSAPALSEERARALDAELSGEAKSRPLTRARR